MNAPLISIIIPAYNRAHLISETLDSVLAQTYTNWECIVVDDGSTDDTEIIVNRWLLSDDRFKYIKVKNAGASNARNVGLANAKGDYIQFLDSDDLLNETKIEKQLNQMISQNADISFSNWSSFSTNIAEHSGFKFKNINYPKTCNGKELMISFGMENWFMPLFCWLTHKNLLKKAGNWNTEITNNDDGEYFSRVLYNSQKVICIDQILGFYRVLPYDSLSSLNTADKFEAAFTSYGLVTALLKKDENLALLSYPKRMYYQLFCWAKNDYPELSKVAAREFDKLNANCFLSKKKKYWMCIKWFGLNYGTTIYKKLVNICATTKKMVK